MSELRAVLYIQRRWRGFSVRKVITRLIARVSSHYFYLFYTHMNISISFLTHKTRIVSWYYKVNKEVLPFPSSTLPLSYSHPPTHSQALLVQRCYRGYVGREKARAARAEADRRLRERYFSTAATEVQRHWRGYWSRKMRLDFAQRRQFLQAVQKQNRKVRAEGQQELEQSLLRMAQESDQRAQRGLERGLSKMNHMV